MSTGRLEAFIDGVIAIIITIMGARAGGAAGERPPAIALAWFIPDRRIEAVVRK